MRESEKHKQQTSMEKVIIVDWGTTSLRAILVDSAGSVIAEIESEKGIQFIKDQKFQIKLLNAIDPWFEKDRPLPVTAINWNRSGSLDHAGRIRYQLSAHPVKCDVRAPSQRGLHVLKTKLNLGI